MSGYSLTVSELPTQGGGRGVGGGGVGGGGGGVGWGGAGGGGVGGGGGGGVGGVGWGGIGTYGTQALRVFNVDLRIFRYPDFIQIQVGFHSLMLRSYDFKNQNKFGR